MCGWVFNPHEPRVVGPRGRLRACVEQLKPGALSLNRLCCGAAIEGDADRLGAHSLLSMPTRGSVRFSRGHRAPEASRRQAGVVNAGKRCQFTATMDLEQVALQLERSAVDAGWCAFSGAPKTAAIDFESGIATDSPAWRAFAPVQRRARLQERLLATLLLVHTQRSDVNAIGDYSALLAEGHSLNAACSALLQLLNAEVSYLLDSQARSTGGIDWTPSHRKGEPLAFAPMRQTAGEQRRRPYYRHGMENGSPVQVTMPYHSVHGAHLCVTVSVAFRGTPGAALQVVDCDIGWEGRGRGARCSWLRDRAATRPPQRRRYDAPARLTPNAHIWRAPPRPEGPRA